VGDRRRMWSAGLSPDLELSPDLPCCRPDPRRHRHQAATQVMGPGGLGVLGPGWGDNGRG
jgi:hypothetical protein